MANFKKLDFERMGLTKNDTMSIAVSADGKLYCDTNTIGDVLARGFDILIKLNSKELDNLENEYRNLFHNLDIEEFCKKIDLFSEVERPKAFVYVLIPLERIRRNIEKEYYLSK